MEAIISRSCIHGAIQAPASKSSMQRACAAALLHTGTATIYNPGNSDDDRAVLKIIQQLGAKVIENDQILTITSTGFPGKEIQQEININCGESGLAIRMLTPVVALANAKINITGEGSLVKRPMHFFEEIMPQLGVKITTADGKLPFQLNGPLQMKDLTIDGSLSSQFLTGLLFAFAKAATEQVTITVTNLKSKPYIDLTLQVLKDFGYNIENDHYERFIIHPSNKISGDINYTVEGDWSGAAFLLVAGAIAGNISVKGLSEYSSQGDKAILTVLKECGAITNPTTNNQQPSTINIQQPISLKPFSFDATDCPDLFPPLAALAANCEGISYIKGTNRLQGKESDRAAALTDIFGKMGIKISVENDVMKIEGGKIESAEVNSHHDHRIVMAAAIAGLNADQVIIHGAEAINKSYPAFFEDLKKTGALIEIRN
jgi:3-phosphoshikimate 1-carboxyvinyltransferase